jgi:hypothetical protein
MRLLNARMLYPIRIDTLQEAFMHIALSAELELALTIAAQRDVMPVEEFVIAAIREKIQIPQAETEIANNSRWLAEGGTSGVTHPLDKIREEWREQSMEDSVPAKVQQSFP